MHKAGLSADSKNKKMLTFESVEAFNLYRENLKKGVSSSVNFGLDINNFKEITGFSKSSNGDRVFQSGNTIVNFGSGCPPQVLDPAEVCSQGGGGSNHRGCGTKITYFSKPNLYDTGQYNIMVNYTEHENGTTTIKVTSTWTGDHQHGRYEQKDFQVRKNSKGTYDFEIYGKATGDIGVSLNPLGVGVSANWTSSYMVHGKGTYDPCGGNGLGSGKLDTMYQLANSNSDD